MENANPTADAVKYAGFWRRFTAYGIDQTIVQIIAFTCSAALGGVANAQTVDENLNALIRMGWIPKPVPGQSINDVLAQSGVSISFFSGYDVVIFLMFSFLYHVWFTASPWQATPGKRWCDIHVVRTDGQLITLGFSAIRWFARLMSWFTFGLGFIMAGFSREKTAMHDAICGTRVVYGKR